MKTSSFVRLASVGALSLVAASAYGQIWVSGDATSTASTPQQAFGHRFQVGGSNLTLTQLGVFVGGGSPVGTVQIRLWDSAGSPVGGANQQFGPGVTTGNVVGNYEFFTLLSPVTLLAGQTYTLGYTGFSSEQIGDTGGGTTAPSFNAVGVTYLGDFVASDIGDKFPDISVGSNIFKGPNMVVPEPETYAFIAGLGLVGYGLYRRRPKKKDKETMKK